MASLCGLSTQLPGTLRYPKLPLSSSAETGNDRFPPSSPTREHSSDCVIHDEGGKSILAATNDRESTALVSDEPFRGPRGFHIPKNRLETALNASPGSVASYWQYTLYQGPGGEKDKVKLHYCKNKEATEAVAQLFVNESVIGFDIEWSVRAKSTDGIKKNVALIQIACEERIALFHIARYPDSLDVDDFVAPSLKQIMESPKVTKVGVAIKADCTRLKNFLGIHCQGLFELSYLHNLVNYCSGNIEKVDRKSVRLDTQVQEHLNLPLLKGDVQTSDWGRDLDFQQTQYAASDSYAGLQLFHVLEGKRRAFDPIPPRPAHAELNIAISLGDQLRRKQCVDRSDDEGSAIDAVSVFSSEVSIEELAREYFHVSLDNSARVEEEAITSSVVESNTLCGMDSDSGLSGTHIPTALAAEEAGKHLPCLPSSPELELANRFATSFSQYSTKRVAPQALRAYSLWHEQEMSIQNIASTLRQPPIQYRTVITYICDAIAVADLSHEPRKVLEFASVYSYQPFIKAHKDLFERARRQVWRERMIEAQSK